MTRCEYQILEFARSELQSKGNPFAIILYLDQGDPHPLKGFVIKGWENALPEASADEISSIREFLDDVRYYAKENEERTRMFFSRLASLSVGSIRKLRTGTCALKDLDKVCPRFFELSECSVTWQNHFDRIDSDLS